MLNSIPTDGCGFCRSTLSLKTNKREMDLFKKGSRFCYSIGEFSHSNSVTQFGESRARKGFGQYVRELIFSGYVLYFNFTFVDLLACVVVSDEDVFCALVVFRVVGQRTAVLRFDCRT
jgi:hypothetical protein